MLSEKKSCGYIEFDFQPILDKPAAVDVRCQRERLADLIRTGEINNIELPKPRKLSHPLPRFRKEGAHKRCLKCQKKWWKKYCSNTAPMSSDVFRPTNGPLLVRGNLSNGVGGSYDSYMSKRPSTNSGYRFGQLSHNQFFARHNPHPARVRHIKGLLDVPICSVNDDGYFSNPRYSLKFPPNNFNQNKLNQSKLQMPANAINVNSQRHPINTITGLQYFMGKPLNMRIFREKAIPNMGLVPVTETWRDELRALTEAAGLLGCKKEEKLPEPQRPRTSQYSATTGRLLPPPSRAMSRQASRQGSRCGKTAGRKEPFSLHHHITEDPDNENMVLQMLCQILQTDDVNAVQAWLCSAGDREKNMVLEMIRSAIAGSEEYYKQNEKPDCARPESMCKITEEDFMPNGRGDGVGEVLSRVDRLSLIDGEREHLEDGQRKPFNRYSPTNEVIPENEYNPLPPVTPDVFRPPTRSQARAASRCGSRIISPGKSKPTTPAIGEAKLRYTTSDRSLQNCTPEPSKSNVWQPEQSTVQA